MTKNATPYSPAAAGRLGATVYEDYPLGVAVTLEDGQVPLDVPAEVVTVYRVARLRDELERSLRGEVRRLRVDGVSWASIGVALGVSAQAAQQRYRDVAPRVRRREGSNA